ncbi:MAG: hypothetical protein H0U21_16735 [Acidimicrobiia bacterium]|nr:hypothetical protein [Acidimicrobiia bacterium]
MGAATIRRLAADLAAAPSAAVYGRIGTTTVAFGATTTWLVAPIEVTDDIRPGVVSLPHGWGHGQPGTRLRVAAERSGVNSNVLTDDEALDPLSGTSVLNGIPVSVVPA